MNGRFARLQVTPFSSKSDYERVVDYFLRADEAFLTAMGVDKSRLPARETWLSALLPDLTRVDSQKQAFYLGWDDDGTPVGHCNVNRLIYGEQAYVHLHLWDPSIRSAGLGAEFLRRSVRIFFQRLALQRLYCEPYAYNPAPNRVLVKVGFRFTEKYRTTPGVINFEQEVNRYVIDRESTE
jgi:RimJ/RimL family protein N-acetyltransferase